MATKTEERLKIIMKEYIDERQTVLEKAVIENTCSIFLAGTISGILLAYTSIAPLGIGLIAGYAIAKKNVPIIDRYLLSYLLSFIQKGREMVSNGL